jgi:ABC-type amino acid transport system permease subunit
VIKETSLAATFFIGDLMTVQNYIGKESLLYLEAYIVVAIFYFISTFTLSRVIGRFELRLKTSD